MYSYIRDRDKHVRHEHAALYPERRNVMCKRPFSFLDCGMGKSTHTKPCEQTAAATTTPQADAPVVVVAMRKNHLVPSPTQAPVEATDEDDVVTSTKM